MARCSTCCRRARREPSTPISRSPARRTNASGSANLLGHPRRSARRLALEPVEDPPGAGRRRIRAGRRPQQRLAQGRDGLSPAAAAGVGRTFLGVDGRARSRRRLDPRRFPRRSFARARLRIRGLARGHGQRGRDRRARHIARAGRAPGRRAEAGDAACPAPASPAAGGYRAGGRDRGAGGEGKGGGRPADGKNAAAPAQFSRKSPTAAQDPRRAVHFCRALDGTRLAFAKTGSGPPILRAAHRMSHLTFDWDSPIWRHLMSELSRENQLVRL